jgi:hypothetical protein
MNMAYLIYQAERPRSAAEQREADVQAGELAAAFARAGRSGRRAVSRPQGTWRQGTRRAGRRAVPASVACAIPRPRKPTDR